MNFEALIYNFPDSKKMCLRYYLFNPQLTQMMENDQQNITHTVPNLNQQRAMQFPLNMNFDKMTGQQESSFVASRLPVSYCNPNLQHLNVDILTPSKPSSSHARYFKNEPVWYVWAYFVVCFVWFEIDVTFWGFHLWYTDFHLVMFLYLHWEDLFIYVSMDSIRVLCAWKR